MAFLRLFAGYGGDKQRLIKWADGQAVGDGLSMSIGLRRVGNDTKMTCDFFQTFNMQRTLAVIHPPNFQVLFLVRFFSVFFYVFNIIKRNCRN